MAKFTLEQICEKMECTVHDIAEAIITQSKNNQRIIAEAKKENELKIKEINTNMKALEAENGKLRALIDNFNLTNQWRDITQKINSSKRVAAESKKEPERPPLEIVKP